MMKVECSKGSKGSKGSNSSKGYGLMVMRVIVPSLLVNIHSVALNGSGVLRIELPILCLHHTSLRSSLITHSS